MSTRRSCRRRLGHTESSFRHPHDQPLGVGDVRRGLQRAVHVQGAQIGEVPSAGGTQFALLLGKIHGGRLLARLTSIRSQSRRIVTPQDRAVTEPRPNGLTFDAGSRDTSPCAAPVRGLFGVPALRRRLNGRSRPRAGRRLGAHDGQAARHLSLPADMAARHLETRFNERNQTMHPERPMPLASRRTSLINEDKAPDDAF